MSAWERGGRPPSFQNQLGTPKYPCGIKEHSDLYLLSWSESWEDDKVLEGIGPRDYFLSQHSSERACAPKMPQKWVRVADSGEQGMTQRHLSEC